MDQVHPLFRLQTGEVGEVHGGSNSDDYSCSRQECKGKYMRGNTSAYS